MAAPPVPVVPGLRKAAIIIMALGDEHATEIFKYLQEDEIERIAREVAAIGHVPADVGEVDVEPVKAQFPIGTVNVSVQRGGLLPVGEAFRPEFGDRIDAILVVNAAIVVRIP